MSRQPPMAPCLALLKAFDPTNPTPQLAIQNAALALEDAMEAAAFADLNFGQFAALTDRVIDMGIVAFGATKLFELVNGGNFTLPIYEFKTYGNRGLAELDVWLVGDGG